MYLQCSTRYLRKLPNQTLNLAFNGEQLRKKVARSGRRWSAVTRRQQRHESVAMEGLGDVVFGEQGLRLLARHEG